MKMTKKEIRWDAIKNGCDDFGYSQDTIDYIRQSYDLYYSDDTPFTMFVSNQEIYDHENQTYTCAVVIRMYDELFRFRTVESCSIC